MIKDIQIFFNFADFYQRLIQGFGKIVRLFTLMLRMSFLTKSSKNLQLLMDMAKSDKVRIGNGYDCKNKIIKKLLSTSLNKALSYLTPNTKQVLT